MATTTLSVASDRGGGEAILFCNPAVTLANAADQSESFVLPSGFGDCILLDVYVVVTGIATLVASVETLGPVVQMASNHDFLGVGRWTKYFSNAIATKVDRIGPMMWRTQESLLLGFVEVDTNAAPTSALNVICRVQRLRNLGS